MTKSSRQIIFDSRKLLMNPYAHQNDVGSYSAIVDGIEINLAATDKIAASRRLLQDPYAYLNESGGFTATDDSLCIGLGARALPLKMHGAFASMVGNKKNSRHSNTDIETKAINLQREMWRAKNQIFLDSKLLTPLEILDPAIAFALIGYDFNLEETLGQHFNDGRQIEVAGTIDDSSKQVRISRQFAHDVRNFTTAHELGHALLHDARGLHRDRPLDGSAIAREPIEIEADKFASYFLMPEKLVRTYFENLFGTSSFFLDEGTSFALSRGTSINLDRDCRNLRDLSKILASCESYNGIRFVSLARQFRVSPGAMAIRLEELGLVNI
jgi:hypothetical protein